MVARRLLWAGSPLVRPAGDVSGDKVLPVEPDEMRCVREEALTSAQVDCRLWQSSIQFTASRKMSSTDKGREEGGVEPRLKDSGNASPLPYGHALSNCKSKYASLKYTDLRREHLH